LCQYLYQRYFCTYIHYHSYIYHSNPLLSPYTPTDSSFESSEIDTFIGEITISTPKSKSVTFAEDDNNNNTPTAPTPTQPGFYATLSPEKLATLVEDVDDDAGEMSDPDEADYWYSNLNESPMKKKLPTIVTENDTDDDDVPEINVDGVDMPEIGSQNNTININSTQQQLEIGFPQFLLLMICRHMFGSWLPQLNSTTFLFNNSKLITQYECSNKSEEEKKDFGKMMTLRTLEYSDSSLEVVPQLKEAEGSSKDSLIPVIE